MLFFFFPPPVLFPEPTQLLHESAEKEQGGKQRGSGFCFGLLGRADGGLRLSVVVWEKRNSLGFFYFFFLEQSGSLSYTQGTVALNSRCALLRAAVISMLTCVDFCFLPFLVQHGNGTCKPVTQNTELLPHPLGEPHLTKSPAGFSRTELRSCFFSTKDSFCFAFSQPS